MKTRLYLLLCLSLLTGFSTIFAQGFTPPSEGKAVVYFTRVTMYGAGVSFEFFDNDQFIGIFKGKNYMRYECDPGEQLFWASSENKEFITAEFEAGKTYIVMVNVIMGAWKAHVGLSPVAENDSDDFKRAKELIQSKAPVVTPEKKINSTNEKLKDFIPERLEQYENEWKDTKNFKHISADMAISEEAMK